MEVGYIHHHEIRIGDHVLVVGVMLVETSEEHMVDVGRAIVKLTESEGVVVTLSVRRAMIKKGKYVGSMSKPLRIGRDTPVVRVYTDEEILATRSARGGFTQRGLASLGVSWPPSKGWRKKLLAGLDPNR